MPSTENLCSQTTRLQVSESLMHQLPLGEELMQFQSAEAKGAAAPNKALGRRSCQRSIFLEKERCGRTGNEAHGHLTGLLFCLYHSLKC